MTILPPDRRPRHSEDAWKRVVLEMMDVVGAAILVIVMTVTLMLICASMLYLLGLVLGIMP